MAPYESWTVLAQHLRQRGIQHVFGLPGDDLEAWHAFTDAGLRFHLVNDQRHGGYQAIASVLVKEQPFGVLVLGKGPAVTHAATAILEAREQRVPLLIVSCGVDPRNFGTGAFQELDSTETTAPLTFGHARAETAKEVLAMATTLIDCCLFSRRGPVHLEIPEGRSDALPIAHPLSITSVPINGATSSALSSVDYEESLVTTLETARRPAILLGGGAQFEEDGRLADLACLLDSAVLCTASGRGAFDEANERFIGVSGLYLPEQCRSLVTDIDVLLVLGSRLEETATLGWDLSGKTVVQVNMDPLDLRDSLPGLGLVTTVEHIVGALLSRTWAGGMVEASWRQRIKAAHASLSSTDVSGRTSAVAEFLRTLSIHAPEDLISVHENGLQDIWSYATGVWPITAGMSCVVPSEQTPLGFGVSAALGAARIQSRPVLGVVGDGAFSGLGGELAHLRGLSAPLVLLVFNNFGYGWLQANLEASYRDRPERARSFEGREAVFCRPVTSEEDTRYPDLVEGLGRAANLDVITVDLRPTFDRLGGLYLQEMASAIWDRLATARTTGLPVVVNVLVNLHDVPPGFEELAGDVPAWALIDKVAPGAHT